MTEENIRDGYEQLDSALHVPRDAFDRIRKHMEARRRRRRIVAAGVVAAVGGFAVVSMGDPDVGRQMWWWVASHLDALDGA